MPLSAPPDCPSAGHQKEKEMADSLPVVAWSLVLSPWCRYLLRTKAQVQVHVF